MVIPLISKKLNERLQIYVMTDSQEFGDFLDSFFKRAVERNLKLELEFDSQKFTVDGKTLTLDGKIVLNSCNSCEDSSDCCGD